MANILLPFYSSQFYMKVTCVIYNVERTYEYNVKFCILIFFYVLPTFCFILVLYKNKTGTTTTSTGTTTIIAIFV